MSTVNYISHLNSFMTYLKRDNPLNVYHVGLYLALFHAWNNAHFASRFPVTRKALKRVCRIGTDHTYAKCMKELNDIGLISYQRSTREGVPSIVSMTLLDKAGKLLSGNTHDENHITCFMENHMGSHVETNTIAAESFSASLIKQSMYNGKVEREKEKRIPQQEEVRIYFKNLGINDTEASKFFHYYTAKGWLVGGRIVKDWHSLAAKWLTNIHSFTSQQYHHGNTGSGALLAGEEKVYSAL